MANTFASAIQNTISESVTYNGMKTLENTGDDVSSIERILK